MPCRIEHANLSTHSALKYIWKHFTAVSFSLAGILSATGNGYVIYMSIKRKTKLKPPELMTVNLAIFDFGISGNIIFCDLKYKQH